MDSTVRLLRYWFDLRRRQSLKHQSGIPLETKEVNSVKCKHLVKNQVYTLNSWPALISGKQKGWMGSF